MSIDPFDEAMGFGSPPAEAPQTAADLFPGAIEAYLVGLATEHPITARSVAGCLARAHEACPILTDLLDAAAAEGELDEDQDLLLFRGLHVLGGARYQACFPALLAFLRLPDEQIEKHLGDAKTENLPKIVIGTFNGDSAGLFDLILNQPLDDFLCSGLLHAAAYLTWEGRIERLEMEAMLTAFYESRLYPAGSFAWYGWQMAITLLGLHTLVPVAAAAEAEGLIDDEFISYDSLAEIFDEAENDAASPNRFKAEHLGYLTDVYEELMRFDRAAVPQARDLYDTPGPWTPVTNPYRNVGRNEPCPCGSGKKFKKCCLGK